jgi:hypothetical protein
MRRSVLAALLALVMWAPVSAQTAGYGSPLVTQRFSLSAVQPSTFLSLTAGQSLCSVVVLNTTTFSGLVMRAQAASDGPYLPVSWQNVPAIDGGGISAVGSYVANISSIGITNFRVNITALASGTVTGSISCTSASGGGEHVNIDNTPVPVFTPTPTNIGAQPGQSVISYPCAYNGTQWDCVHLDPSDALEVSQGGTHLFRLSSTSATACTNLASGTGRVVKIWNTGPATTVYPQFYDEASNSCAAADLIWGDGASMVIPSGLSILSFDAPLTSGLTYRLSGTLSSSQRIVISTYGLGF